MSDAHLHLPDTGRGDADNPYSYITTYTGRRINPLDASPSDVNITDIAVALSRQARWSGHTRYGHYSVAEHSVRVSTICPIDDSLWGLLHDASEAYLCDIPRPIKHHPSFAFYREVEKRLMAVICETFGLQLEQPESVHRADSILLWTEARDLMGMTAPASYDGPIMREQIRPWTQEKASNRFLERFERLLTRSGRLAHVSTPRLAQPA